VNITHVVDPVHPESKLTQLGHKFFVRVTAKERKLYAAYQCECGSRVVVCCSQVKRGRTKSCGCIRSESSTTHGMYGTPIYSSWLNMRERCVNPKNKHFKDYGARGIHVCGRWMKSFAEFHADMSPRPEGLTLDRKGNDAGYNPENCRWVTPSQQARNTRRNVYLTVSGVTQTIIEWSEQSGTHQKRIGWRKKNGWSDYDSIYGRKKDK
jgi:hypothetical protein